MSRLALTEHKCRTLKPGPRRRFVLDAMVPGLVLQVTPQGHRSFMLRGLFPGGKHRVRRLLGEVGTIGLDQARAEARRWLELLSRGLDPKAALAEQRRMMGAAQALTFAVVADAYIADRLRDQRQGVRSAREIRTELVACWGSRPLTAISRGDVINLIDGLKARARRNVGERASFAYSRLIFAHCRALFGWAAMRYDLERSPCDRLRPKNLNLVMRPRERVLTDGEIRALWSATAKLGFPFGSLLRLLLLSGARKSEASDSTWSEFNFDAKVWVIPASRFKSNSEHRIPLTDDMLALLGELPRFHSGNHLFSTTYGKTSVKGFSKATARLHRLMRAELPDLPPFSKHDLRRTMRTRLSELRVPEHIAEAVIGHAPRGLARIYNQHRFADEIREALELWHRRLRTILEPAPANANVVPLRA